VPLERLQLPLERTQEQQQQDQTSTMPTNAETVVGGFPHPTISPINGVPNYESILSLNLQLNANARSGSWVGSSGTSSAANKLWQIMRMCRNGSEVFASREILFIYWNVTWNTF
jgi:hypothetical protein